ncbi:hypothetical protein Droror1_Dr00021272 [Drosera rotundifolia]
MFKPSLIFITLLLVTKPHNKDCFRTALNTTVSVQYTSSASYSTNPKIHASDITKKRIEDKISNFPVEAKLDEPIQTPTLSKIPKLCTSNIQAPSSPFTQPVFRPISFDEQANNSGEASPDLRGDESNIGGEGLKRIDGDLREGSE